MQRVSFLHSRVGTLQVHEVNLTRRFSQNALHQQGVDLNRAGATKISRGRMGEGAGFWQQDRRRVCYSFQPMCFRAGAKPYLKLEERVVLDFLVGGLGVLEELDVARLIVHHAQLAVGTLSTDQRPRTKLRNERVLQCTRSLTRPH